MAPPVSTQPFQREHDEALVKVKYNVNSQTQKNQWADLASNVKTMPNRSSVPHNIINNQENASSAVIYVKALDKNVLNRKKGVTEFADESRITALHTNHDYVDALKQD